MNSVTLSAPSRLRHWLQLYKLYRSAFPPAERKPFFIIWNMFRKGKMDVWYFSSAGRFAGLATAIDDHGLVLIDYLAVAPDCRGKGVGTSALSLLKDHYSGKNVFLEIESIYEDTPDLPQRIRRRNFYLRCGMKPMHVMIRLFGVKMELMGFDCQINYEQYYRFYMNNLGAWAAGHVSHEHHPEGESHETNACDC